MADPITAPQGTDPRVAAREESARAFAAEVKRLEAANKNPRLSFSFREGSRGFQFVITKKR